MKSRTAEWFICTIRYEKTMEDGLQKKVTEKYVVDALSFTEAEARITEQMSTYISGEFDIVEIDRCPFREKRKTSGTKQSFTSLPSTRRRRKRRRPLSTIW